MAPKRVNQVLAMRWVSNFCSKKTTGPCGRLRVEESCFSIHLIPETLRLTTLGGKVLGKNVNIEVDSMTQAVVTTVERLMEGRA